MRPEDTEIEVLTITQRWVLGILCSIVIALGGAVMGFVVSHENRLTKLEEGLTTIAKAEVAVASSLSELDKTLHTIGDRVLTVENTRFTVADGARDYEKLSTTIKLQGENTAAAFKVVNDTLSGIKETLIEARVRAETVKKQQ